jgi:hypothetical protein
LNKKATESLPIQWLFLWDGASLDAAYFVNLNRDVRGAG